MSEQAMDDVSKFLQDVKEMNARRTEEDDARQRELDEKIQQEKRERQARRAGCPEGPGSGSLSELLMDGTATTPGETRATPSTP
ncbi:hypothetical protein ColKHC_03776 [Colletotrichum higginsianum]|nr:hypothetical protein ColKHC_03776 [Colletotrichum higginsianum]